MDIGLCKYCKDSFSKKRTDSKFCSEKCRKNYYYDTNPAYYERTKERNLSHYYTRKKVKEGKG